MKNYENKFIEIFCHIDDFNKVFINELKTGQLTEGELLLVACLQEHEELISGRKRTAPAFPGEDSGYSSVICFRRRVKRDPPCSVSCAAW